MLILKDFNFDNLERIQGYIDLVYEKMSGDILGIFLKKYQLIGHLEALKKYLLLGQGDFIQCLMDLLRYVFNALLIIVRITHALVVPICPKTQMSFTVTI
jgi:gamma-tubulin complex component 3